MIIISGIKKPTPSRVRGLFPGRDPFWAGYGNKAWDILAYKVTKHQTPSTTTSIKIEPLHQFQGTNFNLKKSIIHIPHVGNALTKMEHELKTFD